MIHVLVGVNMSVSQRSLRRPVITIALVFFFTPHLYKTWHMEYVFPGVDSEGNMGDLPGPLSVSSWRLCGILPTLCVGFVGLSVGGPCPLLAKI